MKMGEMAVVLPILEMKKSECGHITDKPQNKTLGL